MPLILRTASGQILVCTSASWTIEIPLGLSNSLAIFARSLLGATPMEQVSAVFSKIARWISRARARPPSRCPPGTSVKSM